MIPSRSPIVSFQGLQHRGVDSMSDDSSQRPPLSGTVLLRKRVVELGQWPTVTPVGRLARCESVLEMLEFLALP